MRSLFAAALLALAAGGTPCLAAGTIHHPAWDLALDGDWSIQAGTDPQQQFATSGALDTSLTTSFVPIRSKFADVERLARKWQDLRVDSERESGEHFHRTITLAEPELVAAPGGFLLTYHGHDDTGRQFRYYGRITQAGVLSMYVESPSRSEAQLSDVLDHVVAGLSPHRVDG